MNNHPQDENSGPRPPNRTSRYRVVANENEVALWVDATRDWQLSLEDVAIMGEVLLEVGLIDHFWVFVDRLREQYWLPIESFGNDQIKHVVWERFRVCLDLKFFGTEFSSRIIWPEEKKGCPLFITRRASPWWMRPIELLVPPLVQLQLSDDAASAIP